MSERQYALWSPVSTVCILRQQNEVLFAHFGITFRKHIRSEFLLVALLDQELKNVITQEIDTSNGVIFPFYDGDTNMIYLCGKVSFGIEQVFAFSFRASVHKNLRSIVT